MPENRDSRVAADAGRSGGRQTIQPDKGDEANWSPGNQTASNDPTIKPGYGSDTGQQRGQGAAAQLTPDGSPESGGPDGQFDPEAKRRAMASNSSGEDAGQQWSPGADQPKS